MITAEPKPAVSAATDEEDVAVGAEIETETDPERRPECFSSTVQECLFVLTATMAIGQLSFFQGAIMGISAAIGRDLHMNAAEITWINAGCSLSSGAFLLTFGKFADMFGRRSLFIAGMAGFTVAVLIAGFANSPIYMDVFSGVLGLFAAAVVPPAVGALGAVYAKPSQRKNRAFACFSAGNPLGFVGGMIISGIASYAYSWRASFWSLAVVYAVFTVLTIWTVPQDTPSAFLQTPMMDWGEAVKQFDIPGSLMIVAGFACFSSSLSLAGDAPYGWKTGYVIALLIVGVALIAGFLYWQSVTEYALMPLYVWRDRNFSLLMLTTCLGFMAFAPAVFWLSLYFQNVKHLSALSITAHLLPMVVSGTLVNVVCGLILHKVSNKLLMGIGALAYTAAFLILSFMRADALYWEFIFPALCLIVVGADIEFNVANMYVMSSLPPAQQSVAGGIFNTVVKLCMNVGLGIATSVYTAPGIQPGDVLGVITPYLAVFWYAAATAGLSLLFIPFLTMRTQGAVQKSSSETSSASGMEVKREIGDGRV